VRDGVAHQLDQRALHRIEQCAFEPHVAAARRERDFLAQLMRRIARGTFQRMEDVGHRHQLQSLRRVARGAQFAQRAHRALLQRAFHLVGGTLQFGGDGIEPRRADRMLARLAAQLAGDAAQLFQVGVGPAQRLQFVADLAQAFQHQGHFGQVGARQARRFAQCFPLCFRTVLFRRRLRGRRGDRRRRGLGAVAQFLQRQQHRIDRCENTVHLVARHGGAFAVGRKQLFQFMRQIGNRHHPHHARRTLQGMRQAQQAHHRLCGHVLFQIERRLAELFQQFGGFDAEKAVRVFRHGLPFRSVS